MARRKKPIEQKFIALKFTLPPEEVKYLKESHSANQSAAVARGIQLLKRHEAAQCPCLQELEQAS